MSYNRTQSHGRGGAGNIAPDSGVQATTKDFVTPTLKSEHYTTGRGGTGNMAKNDPNRPEIARASQDVDPPLHRENEGPHHYGRGGAANVVTPSAEEAKQAKENNARKSVEMRRASGTGNREDAKGLVDKGKGLLGKLGKK